MTDNIESLVLEHLRPIRGKVDQIADDMSDLKLRMSSLESAMEYIENGAALGWLIDVQNKKVYVYQQNTAVQELDNPSEVSGAPQLLGFVLQMKNFFG